MNEQFSLNIRQKGLIIVLVPLALQFVFLVVLFSLYKEAEAGEKNEYRAKRIELICNRIGHLAYGGGTSIIMYLRLKDESLATRFVGAIEEAHEQVGRLAVLVGKRSKEQTLLNDVRRYSDWNYEVLLELKRTMDEGKDTSGLEHVSDLADELASAIAGLGEALHRLEHEEVAVVNNSPMIQAAARLRIQQFVVIGALLDIFLAIFFMDYFTKNIADRILLIVDNTSRLAAGKPLNKKLSGNDEIAHLDSVFHEAAQSMQESARVRRELISLVSHDLRTPLTSIRLNMSSLELFIADSLPEKALMLIEKTQKEINRLIRLIVDLLDLEKMEAGAMQLKLQPVPLQALFEDAYDAVLGFAKDRDIEIVTQDSSEEVSVDPERIVQVLVNFLSNAIKFSPKGGTITLSSTTRNGMVRVSVTDQGPGIPEAYREAIFDRYKQIESQGNTKQGTGLGLAICKAIASEHRGAIGVDSQPGKGSTFWIELPKVNSAAATDDQKT